MTYDPTRFRRGLLLALAVWTAQGTCLALPQPGDVYREYVRVNLGNQWRVTDPAAGAAGAQVYLPNPVLQIDIDDLDGAVRAELLVDLWGGHVGTTDKRLRFNGNDWIDLPELSTTPTDGECYMHQWNVSVDLPLEHLVEGVNSFEGTSGGQSCWAFNWGQWGWFSVAVRIYYNDDKPHPIGSITWPVDGAVLSENPGLTAEASGPAGIDEVQYLAWYDGWDHDGDGVFLDYHRAYHRGKFDSFVEIDHHVGSAEVAPFAVSWDTSRVPDQAPGSIRLLARIRGADGLWYVTDEVTGLSLQRTDSVLRLYKPINVPERYWSRVDRVLTSEFVIPPEDDLADAAEATLLLASYNGIDGQAEEGQEHSTRVNDWVTPEYGADHHYQFDELAVPVGELVSGTNTVTLNSESTHHGMEILWPGPGLLIRYALAAARCGNGRLEAGEACDDGNTAWGDACAADCSQASPTWILLDKTGNAGEVLLDWMGAAEPYEVGRSGSPTDVGDAGRVIAVTQTTQWVDAPPAGIVYYRVTRMCGNGRPDAGEACDDGNALHFDGCRADCTVEVCGDGVVDPGEACDDGNDLDGDGCQSDCTLADCGNGVIDAGEACDLGTGNSDLPDAGCRSDCRLGGCGDGILDTDEACDLGEANSNQADADCRLDCTVAGCGDGIVDSDESCDDGNTVPDDGCSAECEFETEVCGNGIVEPPERCDDGNTVSGDGCSAQCQGLVSDDFSPVANGGWRFVDPLTDSTQAVVGAGTSDSHLVITIPPGIAHDAWIVNNAARFMQDVDDSDFEITTRIETALAAANQMQGLFVEQDGDDWIRFDVLADGVDWKVFAATMAGGISQVRVNSAVGPVSSPARLELRVLRSGDSWTFSYRTDPGAAWTDAVGFNHALAVRAAGIFAGTAGANPPGIQAAFDYFFDADAPVDPEDPVSCGDGVLDPWEECDDGNTTDGDGCQANCLDPVCGDGILDPGEECDDGNTVDGDHCSATCTDEPFCGNAIVDEGEECDDGNTDDGDGCSAICEWETDCGDGIVVPGEDCDEGAGNSDEPDATCRTDCTFQRCGDGILDTGEDCDDGNAVAGDGCSPACGRIVSDDFSPAANPGWMTVNPLGDAAFDIVGAGTSDSGLRIGIPPGAVHDAWIDNDAARFIQLADDGDFTLEVKLESSLDSEVQMQGLYVEQDADRWLRFDVVQQAAGWKLFAATFNAGSPTIRINTTPQAGSSPAPIWLRLTRAGNNWTCEWSTDPEGAGWSEAGTFPFAMSVQAVGVFAGTAGASPPGVEAVFDYFFEAGSPVDPEDPLTCGDGVVDPWEECDDGNLIDGDGCQADCLDPVCGDGIVDPGEECDDGNAIDGDGCQADCKLPVCGDGILDAGEACDEGPANSEDPDATCRTDCEPAGCGDGVLDTGEGCDDGNNDPDDGCSPTCVVETDCGNGIVEPPEECDDGAGNSDLPDAACRTDCRLQRCGDGITDTGEDCDDGNDVSGDGCSAACVGIVSDDFSPVAHAGWTLVDPLGDAAVSIVGAGTPDSLLALSLSGGAVHDAWIDNDAARYMQQADDSDFVLEVKQQSSLSAGISMQGIFVEQDGDHWLRYDIVANGAEWKLFAATFTGGTPTQRLNAFQGEPASPDPLWLRLTRAGDSWTLEWSTDPDAKAYTTATTFDFALDVTAVGVFAGNAGASPPAVEARFDYFFEASTPVDPEDPVTCGDGTLDPWEECDDGNVIDGDGCQGNCLDPTCGDGIVDAGEECDDGNLVDGDGCQSDCLDPVCGDGIVDPGEDCDDGAANSEDPDAACRTDCMPAGCGDGVVDTGETCDDGNTDDGDGCSATCEIETTCGDGMVEAGEECDEGAGNSEAPGATCRTDCTLAGCGDAVLDPDEECDDGNDVSGDGCSATCRQWDSDDFSPTASADWTFVDPLGDSTASIAGAGTPDSRLVISIPAGAVHDAWTVNNAARFMQPADDGDFEIEVKLQAALSGDVQMQGIFIEQDADKWLRYDVVAQAGNWKLFAATRNSATPVTRLNVVQGTVPSADPFWLRVNRTGDTWTLDWSTDGSAWSTAVDFNFAMNVSGVGVFAGTAGGSPPGVEAAFDYAFETASPVVPEDPVTCGDGTLDPWEACDDGNTDDGDGCAADCTIELVCGDGVLDAGEECDEGAGNSDDPDAPCRTDCTLAGCGDGIVDSAEDCDDGNEVSGDGCSATCGGIVSDDFSPSVHAGWYEVDPLGDATFAVTGAGTGDAWLVISIPAGAAHDAWTVNNAARFMQAADDSDFELEVKLESALDGDIQMHGIFVEQDEATWARFDVVAINGNWKLFAATRDGGTPTQQINDVQAAQPSPAPLWLRVNRSGNQWMLDWTTDPGAGWTTAGSFGFTMTVQAVGVFAGNAGGSPPAVSAAFDYVFETGSPIDPEDPQTCGNGVVDPGEECDDGNVVSGDGCQETCMDPACGDGFLDPGEDCDDGNNVNGDQCSANCAIEPFCGDGDVDLGEQCDDGAGNSEEPDANCRTDCKLAGCGDGVLDTGEECDDGDPFDGDGCQGDCKLPVCGDGIVDAFLGETCDDDNTLSFDGCRADCTIETCGDGTLDPGEECDDSNTSDGDGCSATCTVESALCGNGAIDAGEDCDDGGTVSGDGCTASCRGLKSDDFDPGLDAGWTFFDPRGDASFATTGAGTGNARLTISVPAGVSHDAFHSNAAPRMMQIVDDSDFTIDVKVESSLSQGNQFQGVLIEQDGGTWIRFDVFSNGSSWRLFAATTTDHMSTSRINVQGGAGASPVPLWLRIERLGNQWTLSYSTDPVGNGWTVAGTSFNFALNVRSAGVLAGIAIGNPALTAIFDYFFDAAAPIDPEDTP